MSDETRAEIAAQWDEAARLDVPAAYAIHQARERDRRTRRPTPPAPPSPDVRIRIYRADADTIAPGITAEWIDGRTGQEIPIPITSTTVRGAQTEITGWMLHRGYRPRGRWTTWTETGREFVPAEREGQR